MQILYVSEPATEKSPAQNNITALSTFNFALSTSNFAHSTLNFKL
jgi:hypothetical protein